MQTNRLTERLELQLVNLTGNTSGEGVEVYTTFLTIYASIMSQKGATNFDSGFEYTDRISFYIRYLPKMTLKKFRIKYNDTLYKITNITPILREAMVLDCEVTI